MKKLSEELESKFPPEIKIIREFYFNKHDSQMDVQDLS